MQFEKHEKTKNATFLHFALFFKNDFNSFVCFSFHKVRKIVLLICVLFL